MRSLSALLLFVVCMSACSRRVEYSLSSNVAALPSSVDINTASVADLERLPHVGRRTAEAIVEFRISNGSFRRVEELMLVRGISEARFADIRPHLRVE